MSREIIKAESEAAVETIEPNEVASSAKSEIALATDEDCLSIRIDEITTVPPSVLAGLPPGYRVEYAYMLYSKTSRLLTVYSSWVLEREELEELWSGFRGTTWGARALCSNGNSRLICGRPVGHGGRHVAIGATNVDAKTVIACRIW